MNKDNINGFGIGLLAGLVIGGVIALLYAPNEGKKTRKIIRDKAGKFAGDFRAKIGKATIKDMKGH